MTDEPVAPAPPKTRRRDVVRPIYLQERDLDMLVSLSAGRYLTVEALEWLHYPDWRERYKTFLERRTGDPALVWRPTPNLYRRLRALRADPEPLVLRLGRLGQHGSTMLHRLPDIYTLHARGAALLCRHRGYELSDLSYTDAGKRSLKNFEHGIAIGCFYAAFRAALAFSRQAWQDWQDDQQLAGRNPETGGVNYDRVHVAGVRDALPVLPDATCTLAGARYFLEMDRGTTNLKSWGEKIRAYEGYRRSPKLAARYATETFTVLIVAPTEQRLLRIAETMLRVAHPSRAAYLFLLEDRVHPTTIRAAWREVQSFDWQRRRVVDRLVELPTAIRFAAHPLWQHTTA